ncbi:MAG: hypothetical protein ACJ757_15080 [Gaiellaceae bacterium]
MSDQDRDRHVKASDDAEETGADVEAHVKSHKANDEVDEDEGGDDVEAHVKSSR